MPDSSTGEPSMDAPLAPPEASVDVSVVIVVYRTPQFLERCLEALTRAAPKLRWEVIVQDNAPLDRVSELLVEDWRSDTGRAHRPERVEYQRNEKNLGFSKAVNQGIRAAHGRYYLVLNPDVEVAQGSLEELVRFLDSEPSAGIAAPRLEYPDGELQLSCRTFYTFPVFLLRRTFLGKLFPDSAIIRRHLMLDWDHQSTREVDWCIGGCLMVRREAAADVGLMDERFFLYFEDVDWCYRMHQRNWKVVYHPKAHAVHHYQRASAGWRPSRGLWLHLASTFRFYEKWSFILYWLKRRSRILRQAAFLVSDSVFVALAFVLAYGLRAAASPILQKPLFPFETYTRFLVFSIVVSLGSFIAFGLYRDRLQPSFRVNFPPVIRALAWTLALLLLSTLVFSIRTTHSRLVVVLFFPLAAALVTTGRVLLLRAVESVRGRDLNLRRVGVLGPPLAVEDLCRRFRDAGRTGMEAVPIAVERAGEDAAADLVRRLRDERVGEVVLFEETPGEVGAVLTAVRKAGFRVLLVPALRNVWPTEGTLAHICGLPAVEIRPAGPGALPEGRVARVLERAKAILHTGR